MLFEIQQKLAGRLLPGERLLWTGRPRQGLMFVGGDVFVTLFFLVWAGIPAFGFASEVLSGDFVVSLFTIPFIVIGLYMLFLRFFYDAWVRSHTFYAVTDRRLLIWREGPFGNFRSYDRGSLTDMELQESGTRGTIRFGGALAGRQSQMNPVPAFDPRPQFLGIENPRAVFDLIQRSRPSTTA